MFCVFARRGDSNKYPERMISPKITWDCQCKNTRSADFSADRIDVITNFAVITNTVIKRVHCTIFHLLLLLFQYS